MNIKSVELSSLSLAPIVAPVVHKGITDYTLAVG